MLFRSQLMGPVEQPPHTSVHYIKCPSPCIYSSIPHSIHLSILCFPFISIPSSICSSLSLPQDPEDSAKTVLVIRSLVPGGVADMDGSLLPGDRLMFVNDTDLESASLDHAVQVLKSTAYGTVHIGVTKPLPVMSPVMPSASH